MRGEIVAEELRDNGRLCDDFCGESVGNGVLDGRDETAWVDVEVPLGSWGFEVDDDFFVVEI